MRFARFFYNKNIRDIHPIHDEKENKDHSGICCVSLFVAVAHDYAGGNLLLTGKSRYAHGIQMGRSLPYLEVVSVVSCLLFHPQFLPGALAASKALEGLFSLYVKSALYFHRNIRSYA